MIKTQEIKFKLKILIYNILFFIVLILIYLFHLQINLKPLFFKLGYKNYTRVKETSCTRGDILDCNGYMLATNQSINIISWQGTGNKTLNKKQLASLNKLIDILNLKSSSEEIIKLANTAEKIQTKVTLYKNISFDTLSKIIEQLPNNKNIILERQYKRYYPYEILASHILGFLGSINLQDTGKMGLELICQNTLKGKPGKLMTKINSFGRQIETQEIEKALNGKAIYTTLDINIQKIVEDSFPKNHLGTFIVISPNTGAVKSLLSSPTFNPNMFLSSINKNQWEGLQQDNSFINRAFGACYPPASLFKLVTLCAALEEKLIDPQQQEWNCKGFTRFGNRCYFCGRRWGHGSLNLKQALAQSCNIPFYEIGKKIKIDTLARYAKMLGLGQKTNIILPERSGLIPTTEWKLNNKNERWWPGETLSAVIGQSYILTTPLQIACMMSALSTGYKIKPRILEKEPIKKEKLNIDPTTLKFLRSCMKSVVKSGTGKRLKNYLNEFTIYAKTGTAQTTSSRNLTGNKNSKLKSHAWIMTYIAYKDQEPLVLVVLIENAGSARMATSAVEKFLDSYKKHIELSIKKQK